jgi:uncharacterized iron-regulated protein
VRQPGRSPQAIRIRGFRRRTLRDHSRSGAESLQPVSRCGPGAVVTVFLLLPFWLALSACSGWSPAADPASPYYEVSSLQPGQILHLATGRLLREQELYTYLSYYPVVYLGETHDNVEAHAAQFTVLQAMQRRMPGQVAVGMEMLRRPFQPEVNAFLAGELNEKEFVRVWEKSWGPRSFAYYRDILLFCREQDIPVLALNPGRKLEQAVMAGGLPEAAQAASALPEMDLDDRFHRATAEAYFRGHAGGSGEIETFYRIQVLREEAMATAAAAFLRSENGAGKQLLVLAGANHVRYGFGVPRRLFRRVPLPYVVVDTFIPDYPQRMQDRLMEVELPQLPMPPADFFWAVEYEDLAARQVVLGVEIEDAAADGVRVTSVVPGGPAAAAGVTAGDIIVGVDGVPVPEPFDLSYHLSRRRPGDSATLDLRRGGEKIVLPVEFTDIEQPSGD